MPVDNHLKRMMKDLGDALAQAVSSSTEVGDAVRRIQQEGYTVHLVLGRQEESAGRTWIELVPRQPVSKEAVFILDQGDVSLLQSLGIDPTRSGKRRRSQ